MLAGLIDAVMQLERDASADPDTLAYRDRAVGQALRPRAKPAAQLLAWVNQAWPDGVPRTSARVLPALWAVASLLALLGFLLGVGVASAVFFYDGSHPVNLTRVLWVFVALPLLLLLLTCLACLPASLVDRVPPLAAVRLLVTSINLGRLWRVAARLLPHDTRHALDDAFGRASDTTGTTSQLHGRVLRWQLLRWSQAAAVAYQLGVLLAFVTLISVEDRAFGWSTTLASEHNAAARYHAIVQTLATPWSVATPPLPAEAVPSRALVDATSFIRFGDTTDAFPAERSKQWWPFIALCVLTYGLLPRVLTWLLCVRGLHHAAAWTLTHLPDAQDVLQRMHQPLVHTHDPHDAPHVAGDAQRPPSEHDPPTNNNTLPAGPQALIRWGDPAWPDPPPCDITQSHDAGGSHTLQQDTDAVHAATTAVQQSRAAGVVVAVRGHEPPTVELLDLLRDLRQHLGQGPRVTVACVADTPAPDWARQVAALRDPWTRTTTVPPDPPA